MSDLGSIIWETTPGAFVLVTLVLAGGAAYMTGRAVALGWDALWKMVVYIVLLALATRFVHFALFDGSLLTLHYLAVDLVILLAIATFGLRQTRARQMATQYGFAFERRGLLGWAQKT